MHITRKKLGAAAVLAASALILASCSTDNGGSAGSSGTSGGAAATGAPIQVAALSSLTFFPEAPQAVQAVFDDYNAKGGLNGRPIKYNVFDDKNDPAASATAAKDALDSGAVALVGSSSLIDCSVNHKTWEDAGIVSIQGTGVDPFCFSTPNIAAANTGPFFDLYSTLTLGSGQGLKNICGLLVYDDATGASAYEQAVSAWTAKTGEKLAYLDHSLTRGQASYAGNIANLKGQNCDAIVANEVGASVTSEIGEAANQGLTLPWLVLTSCYSDEFAAAINYGADIYLPAEFAPYTDPNDTSNKDWLTLMDAKGVAKTSFAQGGYLAATYFINILESIKGDVTVDSFTAAAKAMTKPVDNPMTKTPWLFGPGDSHQANTSTWAVQVKANSSEWTSIGPWFEGEGWVNTTTPGGS
jgi:branched-chain amino acid transport system substrate-binding protein